MKIWTIKEGEPLPIKDCPGRTMRCGIISEMLAERGHDVTWWTSDFFHQTKRRLRNKETVIDLSDHYRLHMLHAETIYKKNISIERVKYSNQLGVAFKKSSKECEKPDVILCSFPLIDFAYEATKYAKEHGVPIIVDIRDLWPDIIWEHFPKSVQGLVRICCLSLRKKTKFVINNADIVIGVIPKCIEFSKKYGRKISENDEVYYLGYRENDMTDREKKEASIFWDRQGVTDKDFIICWIGQISSKRTDFEMVADVVSKMPFCKFVICGDGVSKSELESKYKNCDNILFPGFLDQQYLVALMQISSVGVIPIRNTPDFIDTINNKAIEYMAGSLCVATTLKGLLREVVETNKIGFYFESGEQLEKRLLDIYKNKDTLLEYKKNARKYFEDHFNSEIVYGKLCRLIENYSR